MDRKTLKQTAKESLKSCNTNPYLVTLAYLAISFALSFVGRFFEEGSLAAFIFIIVMDVVMWVLSTGYYWWALSVARNSDNTGEFTFAFTKIIPVVITTLLVSIIICIGLVLLIVPGIIASFGLSMSYYCLRDDPDAGVIAAMKKSWEIMKGHKMDYFILCLSFIPWALLEVVTCGIAAIYVTPYFSTVIANFYDEINQ